jgi:hypothetical protein
MRSLTLGLFCLGLAPYLAGCKAPVLITDYQQAAPLVDEYVKKYHPNKSSRDWNGPPPVISPPLPRANRQQKAVLLGHVSRLEPDGTTSPQPGARILADKQFTDTDSQGNYTLPLATGFYTIRCGTVGLLIPQPATVHVRPGDSIRIDFRLLLDPRPIIHKMP